MKNVGSTPQTAASAKGAARATAKTAASAKGAARTTPVKATAEKATAAATAAAPDRARATRATATRSATITGTAKSTATKSAAKAATPPASRSAARRMTKAAPTTGSASASPARKTAASTSATPTQRLRVRQDETPWTARELKGIRAGLEADVARLHAEISAAESDLAGLMRDAGDGAGDDQADAGTKTFEREQEISLANNAREVFEQSEHALARIIDGSYGICESCGNPIGKNRLLAFPRATLCMPCKSKQERR